MYFFYLYFSTCFCEFLKKNKESTRKEGKNLIEMNVTFLFIRVAVYACFKSSCCFKGNPRINENHGEILMQDLDFFFYFLLLSPS